jgi:hypothetical protein
LITNLGSAEFTAKLGGANWNPQRYKHGLCAEEEEDRCPMVGWLDTTTTTRQAFERKKIERDRSVAVYSYYNPRDSFTVFYDVDLHVFCERKFHRLIIII